MGWFSRNIEAPLAIAETRSFDPIYSLTDPAVAELLFGFGNLSYSGVTVTESNAMQIPAVYRAVSLISSTLAALPLKAYRNNPDGTRERIDSFFDTSFQDLDGHTYFEFMELVLTHLLLHGNSYLLHIVGGGGQILGLAPLHPLSVTIVRKGNLGLGHIYRVTFFDGTFEEYDNSQITHIRGLSLDGVYGLSPISVARNCFGTALQGERAASKMFASGAMISGMVTPTDDTDLDAEDARAISTSLNTNLGGVDNAGAIRLVNRQLKFTPWTLSAVDSQFLESRSFQVSEIARIYGVPPHLLMEMSKATSFGSGIEEQSLSLGRHVLQPWCKRIEGRLNRLLGMGQFFEFDFAALEAPSPKDEIALLIAQVSSGLLSVNEARAIKNLPPVEGGDALRLPPGSLPVADQQPINDPTTNQNGS